MSKGKEIFFCDGSGKQHVNKVIRLKDFKYTPCVPGADFHAEVFYELLRQSNLIQCPMCGDLIKK